MSAAPSSLTLTCTQADTQAGELGMVQPLLCHSFRSATQYCRYSCQVRHPDKRSGVDMHMKRIGVCRDKKVCGPACIQTAWCLAHMSGAIWLMPRLGPRAWQSRPPSARQPPAPQPTQVTPRACRSRTVREPPVAASCSARPPRASHSASSAPPRAQASRAASLPCARCAAWRRLDRASRLERGGCIWQRRGAAELPAARCCAHAGRVALPQCMSAVFTACFSSWLSTQQQPPARAARMQCCTQTWQCSRRLGRSRVEVT